MFVNWDAILNQTACPTTMVYCQMEHSHVNWMTGPTYKSPAPFQNWICIHRNFCKYGLVTCSFNLQRWSIYEQKKLGYSVVPFDVIYLSIHHINWSIFFLSFQNPCESIPCANHASCQAGFGNHGYRCICPSGYRGVQCETGEEKNI